MAEKKCGIIVRAIIGTLLAAWFFMLSVTAIMRGWYLVALTNFAIGLLALPFWRFVKTKTNIEVKLWYRIVIGIALFVLSLVLVGMVLPPLK